MNNIDGLLYLLNQAGVALAHSEANVAQLAEENGALRAALAKHEESG